MSLPPLFDDSQQLPLRSLPQAELFSRIADICTLVNDAATEEQLLTRSLKAIRDLFGANRASIFIVENDKKELVLKASVGLPDRDAKHFVKPFGEGVVGIVAQQKKPFYVSDFNTDKRFSHYQARSSYQTASFICAPLLIKDRLVGVINISDKSSGQTFEDHEMQLLDFLATQLALNHHRIYLYKKFKSIVHEQQELKDRLGQSDQETQTLKRKIHIQQKLATIGKLAGGIAHEFNNPLDGVMRYTNLSLDLVKDDDILRSYLLEIQTGLNRMAAIVKNLLACSRNEPTPDSEVGIETIMNQVFTGQLNEDIRRKRIQVNKEVATDLPKVKDHGLDRVIVNLLDNAVEAMEEEGFLTIKAYQDRKDIILEISDTGSGIAEKDLEQIFEPFYTTKDMDKGCGLGLTIVGEIIKSYNGKIDVTSLSGHGSTFTIRIPLEGS